jgi:hypothetical protein
MSWIRRKWNSLSFGLKSSTEQGGGLHEYATTTHRHRPECTQASKGDLIILALPFLGANTAFFSRCEAAEGT